MPHAIKRDHELSSKGLVTILLESQGSKDIEAFMMKRFADNNCAVGVGRGLPIKKTSTGLPSMALIGVDGTLLIEGNTGRVGGEAAKLIEAELRKVKKGWGKHKKIRKARALMHGKRDFAGAAKILGELQLDDDDQKADLEAARAELEARYNGMKKSVNWLREKGRWAEAHSLAKKMAKGTAGHANWAEESKALLAEFSTKESKAELALEKKLNRVMRAVAAKGPKGGEERALRKIVKGKEGSTAARAERLAGFIEKANSK